MSLSRSMHLPPGGQEGPGPHRAGVFYIVEHPAAERIPEVMRFINENSNNYPSIYVFDDGEDDEESEVPVVIDDYDAESTTSHSSSEEDDSIDEDTEDSDDWSDWSESSVDSGYESMSSELEENDEDGNGPDGDEESEGEVEEFNSDENHQPADTEAIAPSDLNPENSSSLPTVPTTSTKRSIDESQDDPRPVKRQRTHEDTPKEELFSDNPAPSTSEIVLVKTQR